MPGPSDVTVTASPWKLFAHRGWGSAIAEAILAVAGIPYEREDVDMAGPRERLRAVNPLGQLPTLVLPDGQILTESAAIALYVNDLVPEAGLVPPPGAPERAPFLRWLAFLVAAVYPTFTYGDEPATWTASGADELRRSTDDHRMALWRQLEAVAGAPWFLGERFSALDLYVGVMVRWRPGRPWFAAHCPKLDAIGTATEARSEVRAVWSANFD